MNKQSATQIATAIKNVINQHQLYKVLDVQECFIDTLNVQVKDWFFVLHQEESGVVRNIEVKGAY